MKCNLVGVVLVTIFSSVFDLKDALMLNKILYICAAILNLDVNCQIQWTITLTKSRKNGSVAG
jgi:hypothetical protein